VRTEAGTSAATAATLYMAVSPATAYQETPIEASRTATGKAFIDFCTHPTPPDVEKRG
jgi:hypothetical protein